MLDNRKYLFVLYLCTHTRTRARTHARYIYGRHLLLKYNLI